MERASYRVDAGLVDRWNWRATELMQAEWTDGTGDLLSLCNKSGQLEEVPYRA